MKLAEEKVLKEGKVIGDDILKVDSFVNHQIDPKFANEVGKFFASEFNGLGINKILTVETSGIAFAITTAMNMYNIPCVFAKKSKSKIVDTSNIYMTQIKSFTRGTVSEVSVDKRFLTKDDVVLIVDDFLAEGNAGLGLLDLCNQAGAKTIGLASVIEKTFQGGREKLEKLGLKVVSAAPIVGFKDGKVIFEK